MSKGLTSRRRSTPWLHRWSRPLIGAIAGLGILNTGYITFTKLFQTVTVCPTDGCEQVLSSPYATVFGLPLALFGLLAYIAIAVFALAPLAVSADTNKELRSNLENWTWLLLLAGSTAMMVFSGYLMNIMFSKFVIPYGWQSICIFCIASALFALSLFLLTVNGRSWEDLGQLLLIGAVVAMLTLIATLAIYAPINQAQAPGDDPNAPGAVGLPIQNTSGPAEIALAQHLKQKNAKMYSAYWCPHCHEQKELFGKEAYNLVGSIECAPDGRNSQTALCQKVQPDIEKQTGQAFGFPTWEIDGKFYPGTQTLEKLADLSGYTGSRDFRNRS